ncbi:HrpT family type III secretion system protein [Kosakonia radicincitans]|uniref:HrpT family type III secretion system protein n=1 Tax=Kosakonia radicincitans TaxID=283686 RepID=UPI0005C3151C|nr:HrpT family type III secretion system protein [Kosakonia radicincitans]KIS45841.1 putative hrpT protein [Kosakonia radicincitans YD4]
MRLRLLMLALLSALLSHCSSYHGNGCGSVQCRPLSDSHHLVIWWPSDMRNGSQDYSLVPVR